MRLRPSLFALVCLIGFLSLLAQGGSGGCGGGAQTENAASPAGVFRNAEVVQEVLSSAASLSVEGTVEALGIGGAGSAASLALTESPGCHAGSVIAIDCPDGGTASVSLTLCDETLGAETFEIQAQGDVNVINCASNGVLLNGSLHFEAVFPAIPLSCRFGGTECSGIEVDVTLSGEAPLSVGLGGTDLDMIVFEAVLSGVWSSLEGYTPPNLDHVNVLLMEGGESIPCVGDDGAVNCSLDSDNDGVLNSEDNCPSVANPDQKDGDYIDCPDGTTHDPSDPCPDGHGDACDNCMAVFNPHQTNSDGDQFGDLCTPASIKCLAFCDSTFRSECGALQVSAGNPDGSITTDCETLITAKSSCLNGDVDHCELDLSCTQDSDCILNALSCVNGTCRPFNPALCGNCQCDTDKGEACNNCPGDCGRCPPLGCADNAKCQSDDGCTDWFNNVIHGDPTRFAPYCNLALDNGCCEAISIICNNDHVCERGEDSVNCPDDCPVCQPDAPTCCGDGVCDATEVGKGCPKDCFCGNGACDATENCQSCPSDCGLCTPSCGDGYCDSCNLLGKGAEACDVCLADCGVCSLCGDGTCESKEGETCETCPSDCCGQDVCPDGTCGPTENCVSCAKDCGACPFCGNQVCDVGETCANCPGDCSNGVCEQGEDCNNCPDCACDQGMTCSQDGQCIVASCGNGSCDPGEDYVSCQTECPTVFCGPNLLCPQGFQCAGPGAFKVCLSPTPDICPLLYGPVGQLALSCSVNGQGVQDACGTVAPYLGPSTCTDINNNSTFCCECTPTEQVEATCSDSFDNDCDGLVDCKDDNCNGLSGGQGTCQFGTETTCNDSFDNDGDGLTDCADPNCNGLVCDQNNDVCTNGACSPPSVCGNGIKEGNEACDDGRNNGSCGFCNLSCTGPTICK
jgi:hypothetical protein